MTNFPTHFPSNYLPYQWILLSQLVFCLQIGLLLGYLVQHMCRIGILFGHSHISPSRILYNILRKQKRNLYKEVFALWDVAVMMKFFGSLFFSYFFSVVAVTEVAASYQVLTLCKAFKYLFRKGGFRMPESRNCGGCGFGFGDDCIWIIILLILICCCCGGGNRSCCQLD